MAPTRKIFIVEHGDMITIKKRIFSDKAKIAENMRMTKTEWENLKNGRRTN